MKYLGSKKRIVKGIMPIMLGQMQPDMAFVDAFCGGCTVIQNVPNNYRRMANDNNRYLVAMWDRLTTTDWKPPTLIPKSYYDQVRASYHADDGKFDDATIGWIGFMASRNGRFFDGGYSGHDADGRDYIAENIRNTMKQIPELKGIEWHTGSYDSLILPGSSLIYCDPPYRNTTSYSTSRHFDYTKFYDWCRQMKRDGHTVYVSEYDIPCGDFVCVWKQAVTVSVGLTVTYKPTEKLYTL